MTEMGYGAHTEGTIESLWREGPGKERPQVTFVHAIWTKFLQAKGIKELSTNTEWLFFIDKGISNSKNTLCAF